MRGVCLRSPTLFLTKISRKVLEKAEAVKWRGTTVPYNPLAVHTTVLLILYENQLLDTRFKTLALSNGRPKFSVSLLGKQGRPAPFQLKLPMNDEETGVRTIPAWRSDVQLPLREVPWTLPKARDRSLLEVERSHFWLYVSSSLCDQSDLFQI
jgi:hypothetical protein